MAVAPRSCASELYRRRVHAAGQGPCEEATARVAEATGGVVPKRSAAPMVEDAAADVGAFDQARPPPPGAATGPILVAALEGTGGPRVTAALPTRGTRRGQCAKAPPKKRAVVATMDPPPAAVRRGPPAGLAERPRRRGGGG